jgi:hypothetical protein
LYEGGRDMTELPFQIATSIVCLTTIVIWSRLGLRSLAIGWYSLLMVIPAVATLIFYLIAFVTDWNETQPQMFLLVGAALRLMTFIMIAWAGIRMRQRIDD